MIFWWRFYLHHQCCECPDAYGDIGDGDDDGAGDGAGDADGDGDDDDDDDDDNDYPV